MKDIEMTELDRLRHSSAHIMAAAVCRIYDDVQLDIGPPTEDGFYYDFELTDRISTEDFSKIEKAMQEIIAEDHPFICQEVSREQATQMLKDKPTNSNVSQISLKEILSFFYMR